jgi:cytochrome c-type biogenesis protein CcmH/NrfG
MAVAMAAAEALPVRTFLVAHAMIIACALPSTARAASATRPCSPCAAVTPSGTDSAHADVVRRARLASRHGEWNEAAELWRDALLDDERVAEHWLMLGDALSGAERHREAVAAYQRAIQLDGRLTRDGTRSVARAYARLGDDRQAVRWIQLAFRAGVTPEQVWSEDAFESYRNDPRLRVPERLQVRGKGLGGLRGGGSA